MVCVDSLLGESNSDFISYAVEQPLNTATSTIELFIGSSIDVEHVLGLCLPKIILLTIADL